MYGQQKTRRVCSHKLYLRTQRPLTEISIDSEDRTEHMALRWKMEESGKAVGGTFWQ